MNLPYLRWRERIEIASAEMIVVCSDDDVVIALAGQPGKDVIHGGPRGFDIDVERDTKRVRKGEGVWLRSRVDLILNIFQRFPRGLKPGIRDGVLHLNQHDANIFGTADTAEAGE